jgi:DNA polymerase-3 subunit beta
VVRDIAFRQTHIATQNASWAPTNYDYLIRVTDCLGGVDFDNVMLSGINRGIFVRNSGRTDFRRMRGQVFTTGIEAASTDRHLRLGNRSEVEVTVDSKNYATIKSGPSTFKIIGLSDSEFPPLPNFEGAKTFKIPQADLKNGLKKTSFAISTDETRYVLNGIFTSFRDGKMTLVATDGRRLAMVDADLEFPASHETDVIIPSKAVQEIQRLLGDAGEVEVKLSDSQISFTVGDSLLASKLIEGNYPNYRQVIPGDSNERVVIGREALLETVRRVSILSSDKSNSVKLVFSENHIEVTANSPDVVEAQESMDVIYQGPPMQIAFNP